MPKGTLQSTEWNRMRELAKAHLPPVCCYCGGHVDVNAKGRGRQDPAAPHLDHRNPRGLGGKVVPESVDELMQMCRWSHRACNLRAGQRVRSARAASRRNGRFPRVVVGDPMMGPPGMQRPASEW